MKTNLNKTIILIIPLLILALLGGVIYFYQFKNQFKKFSHGPCLSDDQIADFDYDVNLYKDTSVKLPIQSTTTIYIKDKNNNEEIFRFVISDVRTNSPSLEIHKCGVYVIRNFELDEKKSFYRKRELWRYSYDGRGEILMNAEQFHPYSVPLRVNPSETFLALNKLYFGHPDYSIVIKNLKSPNLEDIFVIKPTDIAKNTSQLTSERFIGLVGWTKDGKYLWGGSEGQTDYAYFRLNIDTKAMEVFVVPDDAIHYGPPRVDTGYIWYIYGPSWVGIDIISEEVYEEWSKKGNKKTLFLYNLFTKEKVVLTTVDDPRWNFKPKWLSDTELEYELPNGEKKIYAIIK